MAYKEKIVIHLNRAHGLPKGAECYVKTKYEPDELRESKINTIAYKYQEVVEYDKFSYVRYFIFRMHK